MRYRCSRCESSEERYRECQREKGRIMPQHNSALHNSLSGNTEETVVQFGQEARKKNHLYG